MTDINLTISALAVLALNGTGFLWLARTLWQIDRRLSRVEGILDIKGS